MIPRYLLCLPVLCAVSALCAADSPLLTDPIPSGWRIERPEGPTSATARLTAPGGGGVRLEGLPPDVPHELLVAPGHAAVALLVHHRKYTDLLAWSVDAAGVLTEETLPILPAAEILRDYPTSGKPARLRRPRLVSMDLERAGWGSGRRLAARARLAVVDDESAEDGWCYVVDAVWSLPPAGSPPGTRAILTLLNVVLQPPAPAPR